MSKGGLQSFEKFNYLIRPSKQVERKLFIETLQRLGNASYDISAYTYLGFGSVFYADFVLFHKLLHLRKMICVEAEEIPRRMRFNKPWRFISLRMGEISVVLPGLKRNERYIAWLDYDRVLDSDVLSDIEDCVRVLSPESIFIVTIDARSRLPDEEQDDQLSKTDADNRLLEFYEREFKQYTTLPIGGDLFTGNNLATFLIDVMRGKVEKAVAARPALRFYEFFNFQYKDGAEMATLGGLIDQHDKGPEIRRSGIYDLDYIKPGGRPVAISVPPLTTRERLHIDSQIIQGRKTVKVPLEIKKSLVRNYVKYYKYYPAYHEILL